MANKIKIKRVTLNIELYLGDSSVIPFQWRENSTNIIPDDMNYTQFPLVDTTGMTARLQIKTTPTDTVTLHESNTTNGEIVLDSANNPNIIWNIPEVLTLDCGVGTFYWDLETIDSLNEVFTLAGGLVTIFQDVTR